MKKIILTTAFILAIIIGFAQNKNLSISLKAGVTHIDGLSKNGEQASALINYHFFKNKRANLTASFLLNSFSAEYNYFLRAYKSDGTPFLEEKFKPIKSSFWGFGLSSQIKLFSLDKKLIPFVQPQILYQRERLAQNSQTFGGTLSPANLININLIAGIQYNKKIQLGFYYETLISNPKNATLSTPLYSFGGKLSYLFNISFKKKDKKVEEQ